MVPNFCKCIDDGDGYNKQNNVFDSFYVNLLDDL